MNDKQIADWEEKLDNMSHEQLARLYRFAPAGHPVFSYSFPQLRKRFQGRFEEFGGMTTAVSKAIGWG